MMTIDLGSFLMGMFAASALLAAGRMLASRSDTRPRRLRRRKINKL